MSGWPEGTRPNPMQCGFVIFKIFFLQIFQKLVVWRNHQILQIILPNKFMELQTSVHGHDGNLLWLRIDSLKNQRYNLLT